MRIQPVQGTGMNAGYDAATKSITISNEGNSPFIYVRVNNKIPINDQSLQYGYYRYFDFYEVFWDGNDFSKLEGGLSATYETRETCPKLYAMPYDIDEPSNIGNYAGNIGVSGVGLVYLARYRGVDSGDGRDVYEFIRSLDPSSKVIVKVDTSISPVNGYYSVTSNGNLDQSVPMQSKYWAKEINQSALSPYRFYVGYYTGESVDPYSGTGQDGDKRPVIKVINSGISGPSGITVVTDVTCVGGSISATYGTFYPSEQAYITQDNRKTFLSLSDTPPSYSGAANYYVSVNSSGSGLTFTTTPPSTTTIPNMSFINLKDCPQSYPQNPSFLRTSGNSVSFYIFSFKTNGTSSVKPSSGIPGVDIEFSLVNDSAVPGVNKYYGTDGDGVKGWYPLPGV